jgi:hypothetical protein
MLSLRTWWGPRTKEAFFAYAKPPEDISTKEQVVCSWCPPTELGSGQGGLGKKRTLPYAGKTFTASKVGEVEKGVQLMFQHEQGLCEFMLKVERSAYYATSGCCENALCTVLIKGTFERGSFPLYYPWIPARLSATWLTRRLRPRPPRFYYMGTG